MNKYQIIKYQQPISSIEFAYQIIILKLIREHEDIYSSILIGYTRRYGNYKIIGDYLISKYPKLKNHRISEYCYWFINNLNDFPKCEECSNKILNFNKFHNPYSRFCSGKCRQKSKLTHNRYKLTSLKRYGVEYPTKSEIIQNKVKQTNIKNIGVAWPMQSKTVKEKSKVSCLKKYGVEYVAQSDIIKQRIKTSCMNHFGVSSNFKSKENRMKAEETCLRLYGAKNYAQSHYFAKYHRKRIVYDNMTFDSSWEVKVWQYCKDNNLECEYQPCTFQFTFKGKTKTYTPDFRINGKFYEVKGDHFFKEDGTLYNPFNHSQDELYEAKHQCMIQNNVIILKSKDIENLNSIL